MLPKKFIRGIADPVSLFALGFLVISLFVGSFVVSNPNITLDIRERAREIEGDTLSVVRRTTPTKSPTRAPTRAPSKDTEDERAARKEEQLSQGLPTATPTPTSATTTTSAPEACVSDGRCLGPGESCCGGNDYFDTSCGVTETRCGTKTTSNVTTPRPTSAVTTQAPEACRADGACQGPGESCCTGQDYFDALCSPTETRCGVKPTIATTAPATPTPTPYCLPFYREYCTHGCEATSQGGRCAQAPTTTPTPLPVVSLTPTTEVSIAHKTVGELCSENSECDSGNCQPTPGGKYCFPAGTAYTVVQTSPTLTPTPSPLTPLQQVELAVAQTGLNLITQFNQTGVAEHVQTQAQAISTDAQVIQTAISGEDLGAGRWVNAGIAVYSALDILSRPLTLGSASLDDVRLAAINWAQANAEANTRGASINDPYRLATAAQAGLQGTALVTSVAGVAGFTPNQAAQELFANPTYYRYAGQYTQRGYTAVGSLVQRANTALGFVDDSQRLTASVTAAADEGMPLTQSLGDDAVEGGQGVFTLESGEEIQMVQQIGAGSQGGAYLGRTCTGSRCVIKLFNEDATGFEQLNTSQMDILRTHAPPGEIARTNLPSPAYIGQGFDDAGRAGFAMEYVPGETFSKVVDSQGGSLGSITAEQGQAIIESATRWQQITGQPHGDLIQINPYFDKLSTGNIILTPEGKAILIDPIGAVYRPELTTAEFMQIELDTLKKLINWYVK